MKLPFFNANLLVTIRLNNYLWRYKKQRKTYGRHLQISVRDRHHCYRLCKTGQERSETSTGNGPAMPMPDAESPFPENWNGVPYDGYSPENPEPEVSVPRKKAAKKHKFAPKQPPVCPNTDNMPPEPTEASSQFEIHSAEEARKAIIWGEILQRKY